MMIYIKRKYNTFLLKKLLLSFFIFFSFVFFSSLTRAQLEEIFIPAIQSDDSVAVQKNIIFRAVNTIPPKKGVVQSYSWDFGDGKKGEKEEVVHIFKKPGRYAVKLHVFWIPSPEEKIQETVMSKEIFVFTKALFLITDEEEKKNKKREELQKRAEQGNIFLDTLLVPKHPRFRASVVKPLEQKLDELEKSQTILIWSDRVEVMNSLNSLSGRFSFHQKDLVFIHEENQVLLKNIFTGVYKVLLPKKVLSVREQNLEDFFSPSVRDPIQTIRGKGHDITIIDEQSLQKIPLLSLPSSGIHTLQKKGIDEQVILLILFLPVLVALVTFFRLVIGVTPTGGRTPLLFTYTFIVLEPPLGILTILILALFTYFFRMVFFRSHLLYTAKVGILTSFLGVVLLFIIGAALSLQLSFVDYASALMMVFLASLVDRITGVEGERSKLSILRSFLETLGIAFLGYFIFSFNFFQILLLSHPEALLLFILANVIIGRFTGLRLLEYFRFREVLKYTEE